MAGPTCKWGGPYGKCQGDDEMGYGNGKGDGEMGKGKGKGKGKEKVVGMAKAMAISMDHGKRNGDDEIGKCKVEGDDEIGECKVEGDDQIGKCKVEDVDENRWISEMLEKQMSVIASTAANSFGIIISEAFAQGYAKGYGKGLRKGLTCNPVQLENPLR